MDEEDDTKNAWAEEESAVVEWLCTFTTIDPDRSSSLSSLQDLTDGVVLFECLSEIAPDDFDPTTIARHLGDNWALKSSNWRKLVRNLEHYFALDNKRVSWNISNDDVNSSTNSNHTAAQHVTSMIAKEGSPWAIMNLVELVAAAAVTCDEKSKYVSRIRDDLNPESQAAMKAVLQRSLARLTDLDPQGEQENEEEDVPLDQDYDNDEENELVFGAVPNSANSIQSKDDDLFFPEEQMITLKQEMSLLKSQHTMEKEDLQRASERLQNMVLDLQERLAKRQEELVGAEELLSQTQAQHEQARSQLLQVSEQKRQLADDLEIAQHKASQLVKAEATLAAYKKKLESQGMLNMSTRDLEDQAASYIKQIVDLEAQVKKASGLQKQVTDLQQSLSKMEREKKELENTSKTLKERVDELQQQVQETERARKQFAEEAAELRAMAEVQQEVAAESTTPRAAATKPQQAPAPTQQQQQQQQQPDPALLQRLTQLEIENKQLREMSVSATLAKDEAETSKNLSRVETQTTFQAEIARLQDELLQKTRENAKISSDKDKLEAYTKRTLAKFQDKYLVALQECKTKLKEKQDKIEALESRSSSERTAQKREERLLSSTIYELGLAIMQNRLKER